MKIGEIWEFDNGLAYGLCRIVSEKPLAAIRGGCTGAYLIREDAEGWRLIGRGEPLTFQVRIPAAV